MPSTAEKLLSRIGRGARHAWDDVCALVIARRQLAELEARIAVRQIRRLAVVLAVAAVIVVAALPLLSVALALYLAELLRVDFGVLLSLGGTAGLVLGLLLAFVTWRRFRREFVGLEDSLAELREDAAWIREWIERPDATD